ncbi:MAG: type II toxin-antitoxin system YoeB family toxin [Halothiobacillus sp.]|nr:type II toxin-antitoxin system YoeB family toxin [Halothiobacillus sp.]
MDGEHRSVYRLNDDAVLITQLHYHY